MLLASGFCKGERMDGWLYHLLLIATGFGAGIINALAGGGPILTLGVLSLTGIDPRIANLTSTVALSPGQIAAGFSVRRQLPEMRLGQPFWLLGIAILGGAGGAALLFATTSQAFNSLVPWLVLLATAIYAASGLRGVISRTAASPDQRNWSALFAPLAVYGGYFGGGNSFLVLALLGLSGHEPKLSGDIKNILIAAINLAAVFVFAVSGSVDWPIACSLGAGGVLGSMIGTRLLGRLPAGIIRAIVIIGGLTLAAWMFAR
jgi:uncharacterized protein